MGLCSCFDCPVLKTAADIHFLSGTNTMPVPEWLSSRDLNRRNLHPGPVPNWRLESNRLYNIGDSQPDSYGHSPVEADLRKLQSRVQHCRRQADPGCRQWQRHSESPVGPVPKGGCCFRECWLGGQLGNPGHISVYAVSRPQSPFSTSIWNLRPVVV